MKKAQLILFIILYFGQFLAGQALKFPYDRPAIQKIDSIELANNGKLLSYKGITFKVSKNYFPNSDDFDLAQPISYARESKPLKTSMQYYYSVPDSIVRLVEYSWNTTSDNASYLNEIFESNSAEFSKLPGIKSKTETENHADWSQKTAIWEDDKIHIKQFMVTGSNTNRVRVLLSWK
jgi:hypothetical protein